MKRMIQYFLGFTTAAAMYIHTCTEVAYRRIRLELQLAGPAMDQMSTYCISSGHREEVAEVLSSAADV
jgi:hypothetical protein